MNQALNADVEDEHAGNSQETSTNAPSHSATIFRSRTAKHITLLGSFLGTLDLVFFIQLSTIYYLDCRLSTYLLRAVSQLVLLSPRVPSAFQAPASLDPTIHPLIGIIFSTNLICFIIHVVGKGPQAGEITQFYNYGGILVDFIGERTPISKFRILTLDILVCGLQIVMLSGLTEKIRLTKLHASYTGGVMPGNNTHGEAGGQDLDAEERGVIGVDDDPLLSGRANGESDSDDLIRSTPTHPLDPFTTGRFVVADTDLSETIRRQWTIWKRGPAAAVSPSAVPENSAASGTANESTTTNEAADSPNPNATHLAPSWIRVRFGELSVGV